MGGVRSGNVPESPILADLHQRWQAGSDPLRTRRDEDALAVRSLGAECKHLPLTDCVYRQLDGLSLYSTEESLFGDIHPRDFAADSLQRMKVVDLDRPQIVFVPLAVGHHVDHQIVHAWGLRLVAAECHNLHMRFYAEFPYSNAHAAIADAMRRVGVQLREVRVELSETEVRAKVNAIACYRSQISTFWNGLNDMEMDVRRAMSDAETGGYIERFWEFER